MAKYLKSGMSDEAKADADLQAGMIRSPLHGIPYGVKDLFTVSGTRTTWGSQDFADQQIQQPSAAARESTPQAREEEFVVTVNEALDDILQLQEQEDRPEQAHPGRVP